MYKLALSEKDLEEGRLIESTYGPDTPIEVIASREALLEGVYLALLGMRAGGSIRRAHIPANLAYGDRSWREIPAGADIVVELFVARVSKSRA
jgi:FKBP-type peptidyl-prolyl cis-trans isomerase